MNGNKAEILLEINSPQSTLLSQKVEKVFLPGVCGPFEVLCNHAPLITALTEGTIRYSVEGEMKSLSVRSGFVDINHNKVSVCLDL